MKKENRHNTSSGLSAFWAELKRRKVMRVAITYAVVAWLIIQVASTTFGSFGIPEWAFRFVVIMLCVFFPVAIILAWAFELTPDGIKTTKVVQEETERTEDSKAHAKKRNWLAYGVGAILPTVIFGALALFFYVRSGGSGEAEVGEKSIAVLPLENMSPDPENAFFADGVQEDILTNLSKIEELDKVISRSSTLQFRNPDRDLKQVGEQLGVRYLVEGSVRRAGTQIRVTVQLIDAHRDDHVWAETYNRTLDDIFIVQAEVAKEIAERLKAAISPAEIVQIERRPTENQDAYDSYIKFRNMQTMGGGLEEEWINQKIGHLEQAVAYDPEFAEAWANLAIDCIFTWNDNNRKDSSYYMRAHEALQQAKRTGPDLPYYHYALSSFAIREHRDPEAAINHLLRALAIDPTFHFAHWRLGAHYYTLGRLAEAQHHFETVLRSEPLLYFPNVNLVQVYMRRGLWNEAIALIQKNKDRANADSRWEFLIPRARYLQSGNKELIRNTIDIGARERNSANLLTAGALLDRDYPLALDHLRERDPEERISIYPRLGFGITHSQLLEALIRFAQDGEWSGEVAEAKAFFRESIDENPMTSPTNWSHLVICAALEKDRDSMASNMTKAREIASSPYYKYRYLAIVEMHIAIAYIVLGENDKAIEILEAASKMDGPIFLNRELDLWFIFDRLRGNPRFDALLKD